MKKLTHNPIRILLADDDMDDRHFFKKALQETGVSANLVMLENGELLMTFLRDNSDSLPDLLFLDLNMPRKNGAECLKEIKADPRLRALPVIIYTTSLHEDVADLLYQKGAHFYMRKTDFPELKVMLSDVLKKFASGKFSRPVREHFVLNGAHLKYH